ncbi:MAG: RIO kinase 1, partial [Gammaproteobacteria bacterium]
RMATYSKHLLQDRWAGHEHEVMTRLWRAGM